MRDENFDPPTTLRIRKKLLWPVVSFVFSLGAMVAVAILDPSWRNATISILLVLSGVQLLWWYFNPIVTVNEWRITFKPDVFKPAHSMARNDFESWTETPGGVVLVARDHSAITIPIDDMSTDEIRRFVQALRTWGDPI